MNKILFGADTICEQVDLYKNVRFGLVTNNAATVSSGMLTREALLKAGVNVCKLFSPEHGLNAAGEDGTLQHDSFDQRTNLPVTSLYGKKLRPSFEDLREVDMILFDIPDVGCRFYTYLWTLTYIMEACALHNKKLFILDRPNPLGGDLEKTEGPMLDEKSCSSFIGRWSIPVRHSCTLGELANYFAATKIKNLNFEIIKIKNWNAVQDSVNTGKNFIPPSPAIKDAETAYLYPGTGLTEGININEGRGTRCPFKIIGAPWIDKDQLSAGFEGMKLPGIKGKPISYIPTEGMYKGETCQGLQFSVFDKNIFCPVQTGLKLISLIISLYPDYCRERLYPTVANPSGKGHLDKLIGIENSFNKIRMGKIPSIFFSKNGWKRKISPFLIYERKVKN